MTTKYASSNISSCTIFSPPLDELMKLPCLLELMTLLKALCNLYSRLIDPTGETGADFETILASNKVLV